MVAGGGLEGCESECAGFRDPLAGMKRFPVAPAEMDMSTNLEQVRRSTFM